MQRVAAAFVEEVAFLGRCVFRVSCYVSQVFVLIERCTGIVKVCGGVNEDVAIE